MDKSKNQQLLINQAFDSGDPQLGLRLLRQMNQNGDGDAGTWHRQAIVEEQIGDWAAAGRAHFRCIELAPHVATGYLYAGYWLEQSKNEDAAAASYALAAEADPHILIPNVPIRELNPREVRVRAGYQLLRSLLSHQHRNSKPTTAIVKDAIWVQTHDRPWTFPKPDFQPQLFFLPSVTIRPWYEASDFDWAQEIQAEADAIKGELVAALSSMNQQLRPYLESSQPVPAEMQKLVGSNDWSALDLYKDGIRNDEVAEHFPATCELLQHVPTYGLDQTPFEVFFSVLKPKQTIAPHYGQSNHSLTVHLALDIPENCYLEVANERRSWQENELLIFDDSFLHSAHNQSDRDRIVLIFSTWHPDLSEADQHSIQTTFDTRRRWMQARREKLSALSSG